jgi:hypothetical protein
MLQVMHRPGNGGASQGWDAGARQTSAFVLEAIRTDGNCSVAIHDGSIVHANWTGVKPVWTVIPPDSCGLESRATPLHPPT